MQLVFTADTFQHVETVLLCKATLYMGTLMDDLMDSRSSPRGLWLNGFSGAGQHGVL